MKQIDETAARYAGELGTAKELASYLRNFRYRLGPDEWQGLAEFRRMVQQRDLLEPI